ncbi:MAG: hydroxymyristoyl-ACP dehydratase [Bacteroidales bacterium]|nr:hydroxymyristoyl-ACP dehydratase [Bacteroidales bacterium]MBN2763860.1 hydroxymyristoyl-ACP dehydratase [Bacteroidales bacterium]
MKPSEYAILELIPQRPPFVMIDRLAEATEKSAKGQLFIKETNVLCHNGSFQEAGLMECIAQTAAAFTGYRQLCANKEIALGYIGAIKNLVIHSLPPANTEIQSEIIVDNELLGYTIVTGKIFQDKTLLAECEMRILLDTP